MGMAASQARLLSITASIHDVEYQAQSIQNAKIQLATQEDQVYQEFLAAQESTTLTINMLSNDGQTSTVTANFNNLCSKNRVNSADGNKYALYDEYGRIIVEDEVADKVGNFDDEYAFAMYMTDQTFAQAIGNPEDDDYSEKFRTAEEAVYQRKEKDLPDKVKNLHAKLEKFTGGSDIYDSTKVSDEDKEEYEKTLDNYKKALYKYAFSDIASELYQDDDDFDSEEFSEKKGLFDYYVELFEKIQAAPGYISIEEFNGPDGDASNNSDWLQNMIKSGKITITATQRNGESKDICPGSDISLGYTQTTQIDNSAYAKAEAKYEHDLRQLDKKDKAFDLDLSKLETKRAALTKEYDSVKTVIKDNIERTFGIFS